MADYQNPARIVHLSLIALVAAWLFSLAAAPWLMANGHPLPAVILYQGYSVICHQMPERSFHYHDLPFAVCARCTGIYAGFLAGLLVYPVWRNVRETETPPRWWLVAAAAPLLIDYSGDLIGLFANTPLTRAATGGILGAIGAWFFLPALVDFFSPSGLPDRRQSQPSNNIHRYLAKRRS